MQKKTGASFVSKNPTVYNIWQGTVKAVDTVAGLINVYVLSENFLFSYHRFDKVDVVEGQLLKIGDIIGTIAENEKLFLIMSKDGALVEPSKYLKCKTINVFL